MNSYILKNGTVYLESLEKKDILISDGIIKEISSNIEGYDIVDCTNKLIVPSFIDAHCHFREPGFEAKATIASETKAALKGGYTTCFLMPNLKPVPSNKETLDNIKKIIKEDSPINLIQLGSITKDELGEEISDFDNLDTIGFSDDGVGVKNSKIMYEAMKKASKLNKVIIAHAEDKDLTYNGSFDESAFTDEEKGNTNLDISETAQLARDLVLARKANVRYHLCHISSKYSLELISFYKKMSSLITAEVTPHHLVLNSTQVKYQSDFKMNPPIRSIDDQESLINGINDGTIDIIACDHAPHEEALKMLDPIKAPFGIIGLELAFPLLYTNLVLTKRVKLEKILDCLSKNVSKIFSIPNNEIKVGNNANLTVIDLEKEFEVKKEEIVSKSKNTPFIGSKLKGEIVKTIYNGRVLYAKE